MQQCICDVGLFILQTLSFVYKGVVQGLDDGEVFRSYRLSCAAGTESIGADFGVGKILFHRSRVLVHHLQTDTEKDYRAGLEGPVTRQGFS